ncbi:MAG TPA: hypothetical protein VGW38_10260 [Chloroflexota bacterium]|nr:hypothetical protein [Chloroflexota bacterium]
MDGSDTDFYSVLIQTTGVFVAIVGGFLATAWITYTTRKDSLREKLGEITSEIDELEHSIRARESDHTEGVTFPADATEAQRHRILGESYKRHQRDVLPLVGELQAAQARTDHLEMMLVMADRQDPFMRMAGKVLAILVVTGILAPLFLMAVTFDDHWLYPLGVFLLFMLGVGAIPIYARGQLRKRHMHLSDLIGSAEGYGVRPY